MKKLSIVCLALVVAMAFGFGTAFAENTNASAKATASVRDIAVLDWDPANWTDTNQGWTTILENTIKTANKKDLFINVSLECVCTRTPSSRAKAAIETPPCPMPV